MTPTTSRLLSTAAIYALFVAHGVNFYASASVVIPTTLMNDFTQSLEALEGELNAWKLSEAGQVAKQNGFFLSPTHTINNYNADGNDSNARDEELRRFFLTKQSIEQAQAANPLALFSTDSPFSLLTDDEFMEWIGRSYQRQEGGFQYSSGLNTTTAVETLASSTTDAKDWTTSGCVARVKDQGMCGSCWAFAAVGALESAYCLAGHSLIEFSEQQVLSCDLDSYGCDGGFPGDALAFVQRQGGVCREEAYPYLSGDSGDAGLCQTSGSNPVTVCSQENVVVKQVVAIPESELGLVGALRGQPVAVGVAAGNPTWKQYTRGVVTSCETNELDHAVLAVGFGTDDAAGEFFKIKNSWSTAWGEEGFIRLKRGVTGAGTCGIVGPKSVYPIVD